MTGTPQVTTALLSGLMLCGALAGCTNAPPEASDTASPTTAAPTTTAPTTAAPTTTPPGSSTSAPSPGSTEPSVPGLPIPSARTSQSFPPPEKDLKKVRISGTVRAGVEQGCLQLTDGGTSYTLLPMSAETTPEAGERVTITGFVDTSIATICMQGTPLHVYQLQQR